MNNTNTANFSNYNLSGELLKALDMLEYKNPTIVQNEVIPVALQKKDILVKSQTGSGKTAAFGIPLCEMIDWEENKPQALILTPTRELALQVKEEVFNIGRFKRVKVPALFGKSSFSAQVQELKQKSHIVVGTPGRVYDHILRGSLPTENIKYLVIDEADEMLQMGFIDQVTDIVKCLPEERANMLFSATFAPEIATFSRECLHDPVTVQIKETNVTIPDIAQSVYRVAEDDKLKLLEDLTVIENPDSCIVFCNTQKSVETLYRALSKKGYSCNRIHGGMDQNDRFLVMRRFKHGGFRYLVATDVAARGIDVDDITHVINYDVPRFTETYVHRIGRTGRCGKSGRAITFITSKERKRLEEIVAYTGRNIEIKKPPQESEVKLLRPAFLDKLYQKKNIQLDKGTVKKNGILKLHINAGKKTKMRPIDIVGTICSINDVKKEDIGVINVQDVSTFVEILNNKGEKVYNALQNKEIKGRLRKISKVDPGEM